MIEKNRNCNFPSRVSTDMRYDLAVEREMETLYQITTDDIQISITF